MLELLQITNDPAMARLCDDLGGFRLFIDWERNGKAVRQAGRNTFISTHGVDDVARMRQQVSRTPLMVRVNPLHQGTGAEIDAAVAGGADRLMLPMFRSADELKQFLTQVNARLPVSALLEHRDAAACIDEWVGFDGLDEVFVGLNDLHLSLGQSFMYEPLASGLVDALLATAKAAGKRVGFGGIARMSEGELAGRRVLGEHLRLGSSAVILSRTFHRFDVGGDSMASMAAEVAALRQAEAELSRRSAAQVVQDRASAVQEIGRIAMRLQPAGVARA